METTQLPPSAPNRSLKPRPKYYLFLPVGRLATSEISKNSPCKPTVRDLHSRTATHFSMIRYHLIRQLWDRYELVFAGEDIMKVSGTTCTSPADATAIVNCWQHPWVSCLRALLSPSSGESSLHLKQRSSPDPRDKRCPF